MDFLKRKKLVGKNAKARVVTTNSGEGERAAKPQCVDDLLARTKSMPVSIE
jgi:hypothetical protein